MSAAAAGTLTRNTKMAVHISKALMGTLEPGLSAPDD